LFGLNWVAAKKLQPIFLSGSVDTWVIGKLFGFGVGVGVFTPGFFLAAIGFGFFFTRAMRSIDRAVMSIT